jgi:hypothetical protein
MRMESCWLTVLGCSLLGMACSSQSIQVTHAKSSERATILPLREVHIFETGMAYFERQGKLSKHPMGLPVPTSHVDDALKTLVILGQKGGAGAQLSGVVFPSNVTQATARAMVGLPAEGGDQVKYLELIRGMKGVQVSLTLKNEVIKGRLVDVLEDEKNGETKHLGPEPPKENEDGSAPSSDKNAPRGKTFTSETMLLVFKDDSSLVRVPLHTIKAIKPMDPARVARLHTALDGLYSSGMQTQQMLKILTNGPSEIALGYMAESPMWRTSYRMMFDQKPAKMQGVLQAWALVHNDTDEDWNNVGVELINGKPDSYLYPMAAPRYQRRTLLKTDEEMYSTPQLLNQRADNIWDKENRVGGLGLTGIGEGGGGTGYGYGYGTGHGRLGTHHSGSSRAMGSSLLSVGDMLSFQQASGKAKGALYSFRLANRLNLQAHQSALVPILKQEITVKPVVWVLEKEQARSSIWLRNTTQQTLPQGPMSLFSEGSFVGETLLKRTTPGKSWLMSFGNEQDIHVKLEKGRSEKQVAALKVDVSGKYIEEHYLEKQPVEYKVNNEGHHAKKVYLALKMPRNSKISGWKVEDYNTEFGAVVLSVDVEPGQEKKLEIQTEKGLKRRFYMQSVESWKAWQNEKMLPSAVKQGLLKVQPKMDELSKLIEEKSKEQEQSGKIRTEMTRLEHHGKALGTGAGQGKDPLLIQRVLQAEDRYKKSQTQIEQLTTKIEQLYTKILEELKGYTKTK